VEGGIPRSNKNYEWKKRGKKKRNETPVQLLKGQTGIPGGKKGALRWRWGSREGGGWSLMERKFHEEKRKEERVGLGGKEPIYRQKNTQLELGGSAEKKAKWFGER